MNKYLQEVEAALRRYPQRTSQQVPEDYIGGGQSKLTFIGLTVPYLRQARKTGFSFSGREDENEIWEYIWQYSNVYEAMSLALAHFGSQQDLVSHWPRLKKWSLRVDNWAHSDTLSSMYADIHEARGITPTLAAWSKSKNPWLRRLSIVSLFYYAVGREKYPAFSLVTRLLKPQLEFDHYYLQKGVGWTLRESFNVYPRETYKFIERTSKC